MVDPHRLFLMVLNGDPYTNNFINIDFKSLFYNKLPFFFINFVNPFLLFKMVKTTFNPSTSSTKEYFKTLKDQNFHHYNIIT
jgi:hypothetical protein